MTEMEMEKLVKAVTAQVLASMGGSRSCPDEEAGRPRCLVIGSIEAVPEALRRDRVLRALGDGETVGNILAYERIVITELTLLQMVDIAQGRPGDWVSGAVMDGLLSGVEVLLLESALPHRRRGSGGSTGLYAVLEGYVRTIQTFGVRLLSAERLSPPVPVPAKPPRYQAPAASRPQGSARTNRDRLLTEEGALAILAGNNGGSVRLEPGTIVTPLAWDVFRRARAEVIFERG